MTTSFTSATVRISVGKSESVRTEGGFAEVIVSDPDVADAIPLTDRSLSILGKPWTDVPSRLPGGLTERRLRAGLWPLLQRAHELFDSGTLDMECGITTHTAERAHLTAHGLPRGDGRVDATERGPARVPGAVQVDHRAR